MAGFVGLENVKATLLSVATAVQCKNGVLGGSAGVATDSLFYGCYIQAAAGPPTLTIAGLADQAGAAGSWVITGSTTVDVELILPWPVMNSLASLVFTASVASKVWVFTRCNEGPERTAPT